MQKAWGQFWVWFRKRSGFLEFLQRTDGVRVRVELEPRDRVAVLRAETGLVDVDGLNKLPQSIGIRQMPRYFFIQFVGVIQHSLRGLQSTDESQLLVEGLKQSPQLAVWRQRLLHRGQKSREMS